jgi:two-component system chemotaxis response regulator CheB
VVQDPRDAVVAAMPQMASDVAGADYIVTLADMPRILVELVRATESKESGAAAMTPEPSDPVERSSQEVKHTMEAQARGERRGQVSTYTCPECGGSLWQMDEPQIIQFRCHVGHLYNADTLLAEQTDALEAALWTSVRTFREKTVLTRQLATRERAKGNLEAAARFEEQAAQAARYASLIAEHVLHADGEGEAIPPVPGVGEGGAS